MDEDTGQSTVGSQRDQANVEDLRTSESRFRTVFENANVGMLEIDAEWRILGANSAYCEIAGLSGDELIGESCLAFTHPDDIQLSEDALRTAITTGEGTSFEKRYRRRDGSIVWIRSNLARISGDGESARLLKIVEDISHERAEETALRASEARFRNVFENAGVGIIEMGSDWRILGANQTYTVIAGRSEEELVGESCLAFTHPDDIRRSEEALASIQSGAVESASFEKRYVRKNGDIVWVRSNVGKLDKDGKRFLKIVEDITDVRRTQEALRESEQQLRNLISTSNPVMYRHSADWSEMRQLAGGGFLADTIEPDPDWFDKYIHPDDQPEIWARIQQAIRDKSVFEMEHRVIRQDGTIGWTLSRSIPVLDEQGEIVEWFGAASDTTDRNEAELALREHSRTLETLNRIGAELAGDLDLESVVQKVTDAGVDLTGAEFGAFFYNVTNAAGESYMLFTLSGADRSQFEGFGMPRNTAVFAPTFEGTGVVRSDDITKDPRYGKNAPNKGMPKGHLPVRSYLAVSVKGRAGDVIGGLFFGHSETGRFTEAHESLMVAIASQAAIAMDNARLYRAAQTEIEQRVKAEQRLTELNESLETRVTDEVDRRTEAEDALRQAQKMETIGQLSGGIAHDFNNLLQIITGNLDVIRRSLPADSPRLARSADNAMKGAERAAVLTQRLLAFSRRQPLAPKVIDPNKLVSGMSELLHRTLGEMIEIETVLGSGLWRVEVDPIQLETALLNLAVNSRDAMPDGGKLTIETCNTHLDRDYAARNAGAIAGQYVVMCVSDTGFGMDDTTADKAFDPFFTTKEVGKGTGLGLSMVYGFVKQSGGHLKIYSELGEGTTIKIYLPRHHGTEDTTADVADIDAPEAVDGETILVCEDDDDVRSYSVESLRELGYKVVEASDGDAALAVLSKLDGRIDMLFTDVVLPGGMTGAVLAKRALEIHPGLKVLFTTGYARNAIVHHGRLDPGVELLSKPYSYTDLAARVRDILDQR